jgi:AraC family transcriptional regulator, transcriptional activator of pobA
MNKKNINYGLYGEEDNGILPNFVHCELLETRSKIHEWEIKPHFHTQLCQVFVIESGAGEFKTETGNVTLPIPCVLLIPENTLHGFTYSSDSIGWVLTLSVSFIENLFKDSLPTLSSFGKAQIISATHEKAKFEIISDLVYKVNKELYEELPERALALYAYLQLLFIEIFRFSDIKNDAVKSGNRNLVHFRDFQRLIRKSLLTKKTISQYAYELAITPVHLNRICQTLVGKTSSQVLHDHLIKEAERYLQHTSYSISEIAYLLDFEYPCYFTRLFKKNVGISPKEFREKNKDSNTI